MERSNRLSWIAIAISVVALLVAFSGRHDGRMGAFGRWNTGGQEYGQSWHGPRGGFAPGDQAGPRGNVGPDAQAGPRGGFGNNFGPGGHRFGPPLFFLPFMFLGGLFKLVGVALLLFLGFKLLSRGRNKGSDNGPQGPSDPQGPVTQARPHQESRDNPYTGETTNL